jgi:hypothetical protein
MNINLHKHDFKKGYTPWNKDKKMGTSPLLGKKRPNISIKMMGNKNNLGHKLSTESRKKISDARKKQIQPRGWKHTIEVRRKMRVSAKKRGKNHNFYRDGKCDERMLLRRGIEYKLWRESVFLRDNFTCIWCGHRGGRLEADHIKPFSLFPELRFAIDNGRTLCVDCHKKTDTYSWKTREVRKSLMKGGKK